jgi:hypothetical protein
MPTKRDAGADSRRPTAPSTGQKETGKRKCAVRESNTGPVELGSFPLMGCSLATTDFTTKPTALAVAVVVTMVGEPKL